MEKKHDLLLASQSPRRRELLSFTGLAFDVAAADVDESILPDEDAAAYVLRLAEVKAQACFPPHPSLLPKEEGTGSLPPRGRAERGGKIVIGSDTAVVDAGEILGKPRDAREAEAMLRQLRGRAHQVYTAIAVYDEASNQILSELSVSDVPMRAYSDAELESYVQSGDPLDKAGAYAIQHAEFHPVERFDGCFASVMGLPLCRLAKNLRKFGIEPDEDLPQVCQSSLGYDCSIYRAVLRGENLG